MRERRRGIALAQIKQAGLYTCPTSAQRPHVPSVRRPVLRRGAAVQTSCRPHRRSSYLAWVTIFPRFTCLTTEPAPMSVSSH